MKEIEKSISVETTNLCNANCIVCPRNLYNQPPQTMPMDLFKKVILELNEIQTTVVLSHMGDPSCDKFLIERLRFCATTNLKPIIKTNMGVWKDKHTDIIVKEKLLSNIRFSVFAMTEEASLKIYGNRFQAINAKKHIDYFIKKNEEVGHPIHTGVYVLFLDENKDEINLIKKVYKVDKFEIWTPHNWSNTYHFREIQKIRKKCIRIEKFDVVVRVNGDVCACCNLFNHDLIYGNVKNQTIREIRKSEPYKRVRDLNRDGLIETLDICKSCDFLNEDKSKIIKGRCECENDMIWVKNGWWCPECGNVVSP